MLAKQNIIIAVHLFYFSEQWVNTKNVYNIIIISSVTNESMCVHNNYSLKPE